MAAVSTEETTTTSVQRAVAAIRELIHSGVVVPGEQLRQQTLAQMIGMSRAPVREALQALLADGVVEHVPNVGYRVTRLRAEELSQIYMMRRLLEEQLFLAIEDVPEETADELLELNNQMRTAIENRDHAALQRLNTQFHFKIFELSPLDVVAREVSRLWTLSQPYRAFYIYDDASCRRILEEHEAIIAAVRDTNVKMLNRVANKHRRAAEREVAGLLGPRPVRALMPAASLSDRAREHGGIGAARRVRA
jgi:DNA-binding GntR family transcriptional regulator